MLPSLSAVLLLAASLAGPAMSARNSSAAVSPNYDLLKSQYAWSLDDRPKDCPPW